MPPVEFLSDAEFYALLEAPYNPAPEYTPEFVEEHELPHAQMRRALDALDGEEYARAYSAMEDCWTTSRYVAASLASPNYIRPDLFPRLYQIVSSFDHDYVMHILSDFDLIPEFALLITKQRFVVRMPDRSQLHQLHNATNVAYHALQRTAPAVTLAASAAAFPLTVQPARQPPQSLSLGSSGV